jgi:hypothetical protein
VPAYASKRGTRPRIAAAATAFALVLTALAALLFAAPALAEKRVALVIGNAAYRHAPALANPKNDAEGVAASLRRLKFEVLAGTDLDKPAMERLLQAFSLKLETADVALVFYAGHGLQVQGRNYLVPVEAKLDREADLVFQAVPLDVIQGLMEQTQRTSIMILDACRDNPLARNLARNMGTRSTSIGRGLGEAKAGIGTLIVYATQPGNVALDGDAKNSPFTAALLKHIEAPGLEIRQVLTRVRNDVITATRDKQVPWDSSSLRGDFFFAAAPGAAPAAPAPVAPPSVTPPAMPDNEALFWQSIKDSKSAADFKDYLARWPNGTFAELAKRRLAEIEKAVDVTPPAPAPETPTPAKPAPAAPQRLDRTSSYDVGFRRWGRGGDELALNQTDTAQTCRTLCLRNAQCVSWTFEFFKENQPSVVQRVQGMRGYCYQWRADAARSPDKGNISGVIRTTPAAAPAPTKPSTAATPAPAPQAGDAHVRELMRKAQAGERMGDFCKNAPWPVQPDFLWVGLVGPRGGSVAVKRDPTSQSCMFAKFAAETTKDGYKVRRVSELWSCDWSGPCKLFKPWLTIYCSRDGREWTGCPFFLPQ